jgi:molecular chaperone DnaJ
VAGSRDYYEIIGVARGATLVEIKKAYRAQAQRFHPDLNPDDRVAEDKIKELNEAYATLSDPERRARYDRLGELGLATASTATGFGAVAEVVGGIWNDLKSRRKKSAGRDLRYTLEVELAEAILGVEKTIRFPTRRECEACDATGARPGGLKTCSHCEGAGEVRAGGILPRSCSTCAGTGKVVADACSVCGGTGLRGLEREYAVKLPPGTRDGQIRMVPREGEPGRRGGPPGDLHVVVRIRPHPLLARDGDDLVCELPVSITQAALGAVVSVPTLEGQVRMRIPEGTQSGRLLRLRGKGVPRQSGGGRGDQLVKVMVETPTQLSPRQRELLEALGKESGESAGGEPRRRHFLDKLRGLVNEGGGDGD